MEIQTIPKWLFSASAALLIIFLIVVWAFDLQIHWREGPFRITQQLPAEKYQLLCPDPKLQGSAGFCIWHVGEYDKKYTEAAKVCKSQGGRLCTLAEVSAAQAAGAEWCSWGWVADRVDNTNAIASFPMQSLNINGCGNKYLMTREEPIGESWGANCCI